MNSKKYRRLALAVTLGIGVSASALPQGHAADAMDHESAATAAEMAGTKAPVLSNTPKAAPEEAPVQQGPALTDKTPPASTEARASAWASTRPSEDAVAQGLAAEVGKTVVEIKFVGDSEATEKAAREAIAMHVGDALAEDVLVKDRDAIYATGYFYDLYPVFEEVPEGVVLTYHVLENPVLKEVHIEGNTVEKTKDLMDLVTVQKGQLLNGRTLQENVQAIQEKYRADGYILAKITDLNIAQDGTLTIRISEGTLEGYKVKGNKKTKERVILREMRQKPGEPFNANQARRSMQRVYNLGFFEDVNVKMNPGVEPNAVVMEIDVKEKRTGSFGIGAGYSSSDGMVGMVSISDTNFRGMGDTISLSYEMSGDDTDARGYTFMYRRPWLDKKETSGTVRLYNRTYEYDDYNSNGDHVESFMRKYSGGELTLSRPMSEYSTNFITLKNRKDKYVRHTENGLEQRKSGRSQHAGMEGVARCELRYDAQHYARARDGYARQCVRADDGCARVALGGVCRLWRRLQFPEIHDQRCPVLQGRTRTGARGARAVRGRQRVDLRVQSVPSRRTGYDPRLPRGSVPWQPHGAALA